MWYKRFRPQCKNHRCGQACWATLDPFGGDLRSYKKLFQPNSVHVRRISSQIQNSQVWGLALLHRQFVWSKSGPELIVLGLKYSLSRGASRPAPWMRTSFLGSYIFFIEFNGYFSNRKTATSKSGPCHDMLFPSLPQIRPAARRIFLAFLSSLLTIWLSFFWL